MQWPCKFVMCAGLLLSGQALASECSMGFSHGVLISPEQIRVQTSNRTVFQINHDKQLFVQGEWITLNAEEEVLLQQYSSLLRKFVPELVAIAVDSVELGLRTIEGMLLGLGDNAQQSEWRQLIRETTYQLTSRFVRSGEHFYLAPQSLHELDAFLHGELKEQLKKLAKQTVGAVWGALQEALRHSDDGFERQEGQPWQPMGDVVSVINTGLDEKAEELELKSVQFCQRLMELDAIESQLQQKIPELLAFDVISTKL